MLYWLTDEKLSPYGSESQASKLKSYQFAQADPQPVMTAAELMSSPVITADVGWSLEQALLLMREREVSHLPVVSGDRLVGLVSDRDLLHHPQKDTLKVQAVMSNKLLTATPDTNLWLVAKILLAEQIHCVVVVDEDGRLEGILTSLDLLGCMTHHAPIEVWM